ncbi:MAG: hypothetical protein ACXWPM_04415 [Bdellovibrionota bacterium]
MKRWIVFLFLVISGSAQASTPGKLTPAIRESLRYRLENLFNEVDLVIRNEHSDQSDLRKLERQWKSFHVENRIPLESSPPQLQAQFESFAQEAGVEITKIQILPSGERRPILPKSLCTDAPTRLKLNDEQIVETLPLLATVHARDTLVKGWIDRWPSYGGRLFVVDELKMVHSGVWSIRAHAFRFWPIAFPRLYPQKPEALLPSWARSHPGVFAKAEPRLSSYVAKIKELTPQTTAGYRTKAQVLLEDARMSFFLSHAAPEH